MSALAYEGWGALSFLKDSITIVFCTIVKNVVSLPSNLMTE